MVTLTAMEKGVCLDSSVFLAYLQREVKKCSLFLKENDWKPGKHSRICTELFVAGEKTLKFSEFKKTKLPISIKKSQ